MSKKLCELRYGGCVIAFAPDPYTLLREKCEMVLDSSVRYPELLKIYFWNGCEWLFDESIITRKEASKRILEGFPFY